MEVLGVGLTHTGNRNLGDALEILFKQSCHTFRDIEGNLDAWIIAVRKFYETHDFQPILDLTKDFRHFAGYPLCFFYEEMVKLNPKIKFILTLTDEKVWLEAMLPMIKNLMIPDIIEAPLKNAKTPAEMLKMEKVKVKKKTLELFELILKHYMREVPDFDLEDESNLRILFRKHSREVKEKIPSENLLILDDPEEWAALCSFLKVPEPEHEDYPDGLYPPDDLEMHEDKIPMTIDDPQLVDNEGQDNERKSNVTAYVKMIGIFGLMAGVVGYYLYKKRK